MQECLALAKVGIPWSVIMDMDAAERQGFCIAAGTIDGGTFDWNAGRWAKNG